MRVKITIRESAFRQSIFDFVVVSVQLLTQMFHVKHSFYYIGLRERKKGL